MRGGRPGLGLGWMLLILALGCGEAGGRPAHQAARTGPPAAAEAPDSVASALEAQMAAYPERYAEEPFPLVSVGEVAELLERKADVLVVDAREPEAYAKAHVPGAVSYPFGNWLDEGKPLPPKDKDLIVYCNSQDCPISRIWSQQAAQHGYTRVRHMKAGLAGWQAAGFPIETGSAR